MTAHRRVVSNRVGSALWYAAALGREIEVYGPVFVAQETEDEAVAFDRDARRRWPSVYAGGVAGSEAQELGALELGAGLVMGPDRLVLAARMGPARLARRRGRVPPSTSSIGLEAH